ELLRKSWARDELCDVLEALGKNSAIAQGLKKPVTHGTQHLCGQRIYLLADGRAALGLLKVGTKRLFVAPPPMLSMQQARTGGGRSDVQDALREINPMCALDFYVHETCQRHGYGRLIFDAMLSKERLAPAQMAYDRPSPKLQAFLAKHFGLAQYRPQNNNFVVFDDYFYPGGRAPTPEQRGYGRSRQAVESVQGQGSNSRSGGDAPSQSHSAATAAAPFGTVKTPWATMEGTALGTSDMKTGFLPPRIPSSGRPTAGLDALRGTSGAGAAS
ncbi:unnamed protein product, partial [Polarella glacialis]